MGTQGFRDDYRAAFTSANDHLDNIYEEYHFLQLRKQHLEGVVSALEPMLYADRQSPEDFHDAEPEHFAPAHVESIPEPVESAMHYEEPQPVAPPAFAPVAEVTTDPLQLRINRALGLAVA
ncbi:MAG TPA: hypothetical protein VGF82_12610 [Terracidiphilus sp.]|jgi:hypothetical protein